MFDPGATKSGLIPPDWEGPRDENDPTASIWLVAPTEITLGWSPGEFTDRQADPEFPIAKIGIIPAALQALICELNHVSPEPPPHEFETMCGRGLAVSMNWAH